MGGEGRVSVPGERGKKYRVRLSGGAYAVYQQLSEEKRADFACIKDVLYTAFALSPVTAYKQFAGGVCIREKGWTSSWWSYASS